MIELEAPEMSVSDRPFSENTFRGKPSAMNIFQQMNPSFYESLDKSFRSASFKNTEVIRRKAKAKSEKLQAKGILSKFGMSIEEAEVLFSYTYEEKGGKGTPCYILNKMLAERNDCIINYRGHILHLLKALHKLEPISTEGRTLYRGIDGKLLNFDDLHYKEGNELTWLRLRQHR